MPTSLLLSLAFARRSGRIIGIPSVCSAHPLVIQAALALGRSRDLPVLIEATCNQVNHEGGYTGMTPAAFAAFVKGIAATNGFDPAHLILGGDHLGPNPWTHLPAGLAMRNACTMIAAYAAAGFVKLHLDASMACADDPSPVPDATIARRNAMLAAVAEAQSGAVPPVYVIGTEVPVPGGAWDDVHGLTPTSPAAARATVALQRAAFASAGIPGAFDRVVGLVVQPGVEFGHENVVSYDRDAARALVACGADLPMLFEAHSTDYQTPAVLRELVDDGFGILKVGPGLTFALREALYALDHIADVLFPARNATLRAQMEAVMCAQPSYWTKYYTGTAQHQFLQRHFSYSDRIRYYWSDPAAQQATQDLMTLFGNTPIRETLLSQFMPVLYPDVLAGRLSPLAPDLIQSAITRALAPYFDASVARATFATTH